MRSSSVPAMVAACLLVAGAAHATPRRAQKTASAKVVDLAPPEPAVVPASTLTRAPEAPPERQRRWGVFGGGLTLFAAGWALDIGLTYGLDHQPSGLSLIPLVGPLIQCADNWSLIAPAQTGNSQVDAQANPQIAMVNHTIQTVAYAVLAIDFVIQLAGLTMTIVGAATTKPTRDYAARPARTAWSVRGAGVAVTF